ncbi:MAG: M1 family metallopeptidase [Saprospiraceae bacterium]|nr:M1 family metallopeptidase [Saprospiraceae bacterium]
MKNPYLNQTPDLLRVLFFFYLVLFNWPLAAQEPYWQQRVSYEIDVDFNHIQHQYSGSQRIVYQNNSPDTLKHLFFHLYPNAFRVGSEMDAWRSRIPDPDPRITNGLTGITPEEEGYLHVRSLQMNGDPLPFKENRTVLEVRLPTPIPPGRSAILDMLFDGQVPRQVRRSGRFNAEGVDYSMSQWYPKICGYDHKGWHANPYVQREFYGVWGDYDVTIHIDSSFILGATGYLQNPQEAGGGYEDPSRPLIRSNAAQKTWHFIAPNVHDFVWTADPDYTHTRQVMQDGTEFHFLYLKTADNQKAWAALPAYVDSALLFINATFGPYPYRQFSVIQGGDGGMEYPMATLISGNRGLRSLVGVTIHELMHTWYPMVLSTNESLYPWMDEGFVSYAESEVISRLFSQVSPLNAHMGSYQGYYGLVRSGLQEPLTTHADYYLSSFSYGTSAYSKGDIFLHQLGYIIGKEALDRTMLRYFKEWQFKHPTPTDFVRVAEREADQELDWYQEFWINTTRTIDYGIDSVWTKESQLHVLLRQYGTMPMPVDLAVKSPDGVVTRVTIPLDIQRGEKRVDQYFTPDSVAPDWPWTFESYELIIPGSWQTTGLEVSIDPTQRMADIDRSNNIFLVH